jgi:hypothetical protein
MATSVHLDQARDLTDPGDPEGYDYKLTTTFSAPTTGFNKYLILIRKATLPANDEYQHVCTVGDIERYGIDRGAAIVDSYYRIDSWVTFYTSLETLTDHAVVQQEKTQFVVTDWQNYVGTDPFPKTIYDGDISQS